MGSTIFPLGVDEGNATLQVCNIACMRWVWLIPCGSASCSVHYLARSGDSIVLSSEYSRWNQLDNVVEHLSHLISCLLVPITEVQRLSVDSKLAEQMYLPHLQ